MVGNAEVAPIDTVAPETPAETLATGTTIQNESVLYAYFYVYFQYSQRICSVNLIFYCSILPPNLASHSSIVGIVPSNFSG